MTRITEEAEERMRERERRKTTDSYAREPSAYADARGWEKKKYGRKQE